VERGYITSIQCPCKRVSAPVARDESRGGAGIILQVAIFAVSVAIVQVLFIIVAVL